LRYGIAVSTGDAASRTLGFFCHEQRPLLPQEISLATQTVQEIHDATDHLAEASEAELTKLRNLNVGLRPT
ncbi:MAG TPA: transcriptional regulator, partial [Paracoccaceae bacterium]